MPTPARFATASRLALGPPAPKTSAAPSRRRSRLRTASARALRTGFVARSDITPEHASCKTEEPSVYYPFGLWPPVSRGRPLQSRRESAAAPRDGLLIDGPWPRYLELPE